MLEWEDNYVTGVGLALASVDCDKLLMCTGGGPHV